MYSPTDRTITLESSSKVTFPFRYIIFGSRKSVDTDIMVWLPLELTLVPKHMYIRWGTSLDKILPFSNPNTCFGHWTQEELIWVQKGSEISETNNSLLSSHVHHPQMYDRLHWKHQPRDPTNKVLGAVRAVVGRTGRCQIAQNGLKQILLDTIENIDSEYYPLIFNGASPNKKLRNKLVRDTDNIKDNIDTLLSLVSVRGVYRPLVRSVLKMGTLKARVSFLDRLDFTTLAWSDNGIESLKFIAYQMGQTSALLSGVELFDKDDVAARYPALKSAIDRSNDLELSSQGIEEHRKFFVKQVYVWGASKMDLKETIH